MRRQYAEPVDEAIRQLEWKLRRARELILKLMPKEIQEILSSYGSCQSREESRRWQHTVVDRILLLAEELPQRGMADWERFAYCPLCGLGSESRYQTGYKLPEGLRRHLVGYGSSRQCEVLEAAEELAHNSWDITFREYDMAEAEKYLPPSQSVIALRKKVGPLFLTAPDLAPQLIDEGLGFGTITRDADGMKWAEQRLKELGFEIAREGNVKTYRSDRGDFVVYADPRAVGKIEITVYKKPLPRPSPRIRWEPRLWGLNGFGLQDSWKNDIRGKYESRLAKLMSSMSTKDGSMRTMPRHGSVSETGNN